MVFRCGNDVDARAEYLLCDIFSKVKDGKTDF